MTTYEICDYQRNLLKARMMDLSKLLNEKIAQEFSSEDAPTVMQALMSITPGHVMARSATNLENTSQAVLKLSRGDVAAVLRYTDKAKEDFRDVIYWALQEALGGHRK